MAMMPKLVRMAMSTGVVYIKRCYDHNDDRYRTYSVSAHGDDDGDCATTLAIVHMRNDDRGVIHGNDNREMGK